MIVEKRPDDAGRKLLLDIADHVADALPCRRDIACLGRRKKIDEDRGFAGGREAPRPIEAVELLELFLDTIGDLLGDLFGRSARPLGLDHHRLDGKGRILLPSEVEISVHTGDREGDHEIPDEGTMFERPVRKVEILHGCNSCPSLIFCPS